MKNKKINKLRQKELDKGIYRILDVPNLCFPILDKGRKFKVQNTYFVKLNKREIATYEKFRLGYNPITTFNSTFLKDLGTIIWKAIKRDGLDKECKGCWLVPVDMHEYLIGGTKEVEVVVDVLWPVKK